MNPYMNRSPESVRAVREQAERRLSAVEFAAYVDAPMSEEERADNIAQREWFCRRYPTALARLQSSRLAYARAKRRMP